MIDFTTGQPVPPPTNPVIFWDCELVEADGRVRKRSIIGPRTPQAAESKLNALLSSSGGTIQNLTSRHYAITE